MGPLNNLFNYVDGLQQLKNAANEDQGFLKRQIASRLLTATVGPVTEVGAIFQNVVLFPFQAVGFVVCKPIVKALVLLTSAEALKRADSNLSGFPDLYDTVARVVKYTVGTVSTFILGFASPSTNFNFHQWMGVAENKRLAGLSPAASDANALPDGYVDPFATMLPETLATLTDSDKASMIEAAITRANIANAAKAAEATKVADRAISSSDSDSDSDALEEAPTPPVAASTTSALNASSSSSSSSVQKRTVTASATVLATEEPALDVDVLVTPKRRKIKLVDTESPRPANVCSNLLKYLPTWLGGKAA